MHYHCIIMRSKFDEILTNFNIIAKLQVLLTRIIQQRYCTVRLHETLLLVESNVLDYYYYNIIDIHDNR